MGESYLIEPVLLRTDSLPRCRALVVDDDELIRAQLAALLNRSGYDVFCAASGAEALQLLSTTLCQIVLTDWQMPDMDGLALCRNLRLRDSASYIYVLMLTVRSTGRDVLTGLDAGADDYIVKGASPQEILARLEVGRRITRMQDLLRTSGEEHLRLSLTDPLTGVRNRRYLATYLPREIDRSRRHAHPLAVLSCDIDRFKCVNDCFGHEAGDEVLQAFVARTARCIRDATDWIARAGGEEFVIVLPETTLSGAACVALKLRQAFTAERIPTCAGPLLVTVSIGVTAVETAQEIGCVSADELLRAADRCLYVSKSLGRDRATAASVAVSSEVMAELLTGARDEIH